MKILYVVSTLKRCGPTNQLFNLIKYLDRKRFEPHLITLSPEPKDTRWKDFKSKNVNLYSLSLPRIFGFFLAKHKLIHLIRKIRPELIHTQGFRADILSSRLNKNIPKITTIHNYPQKDYLMRYGRIQGRLMLNKHISAFRKLDLCIVVSSSVEKNINHLISINNTINIPNGIDTEHFNSKKENKTKLRKKLNLPINANIWISSGHLSFLKDPLFLISQWKKNYSKKENNVLLFIGDGELEKE